MRPELCNMIINKAKLYDRFLLEWDYPQGCGGPTYQEFLKILYSFDIRVIVQIFPQYFHLLHFCFSIIIDDIKLVPLRNYLVSAHKYITEQVFPYAYEQCDKPYHIMKDNYNFINMSWFNSGLIIWIEKHGNHI